MLKDSRYTFTDLEGRADVLLIQTRERKEESDRFAEIQKLTEELTVLKLKYKKEDAAIKRRNILKYVFGGLAIGSFGTSGISWIMGNTAYTNYNDTVTTSEAIEYRDKSQTYDVIKVSAGGVGIGFSVLSVLNWIKKDGRPEWEQKIETLSGQIAELEAM